MKKILFVLLILALPSLALAWGGSVTMIGGSPPAAGGGAASQSRLPTGNNEATWTSSTATTVWQDSDDAIGAPDDSTSYGYRQNSSANHVFNFTAFSITSTSIDSIVVTNRCQRTAAGATSTRPLIKVNGTNYNGGGGDPGQTWVNQSFTWTTNPNTTLAWTEADVEGTGAAPLQGFGYFSTGIGAGEEAQCTQSYITVNYQQ